MAKRTKNATEPETYEEAYNALPIKRRQLLDTLPEFAWNVTQAALAVGYAKSYVASDLVPSLKKDPRFSKALRLQKQNMSRLTGWNVERWAREQAGIFYEAKDKGDLSAANVALKQFGQHLGAFEADNRQRGAESFAQLALAMLSHREALEDRSDVKRLPDGHTRPVDATVLDDQADGAGDGVQGEAGQGIEDADEAGQDAQQAAGGPTIHEPQA